MFKLDNDFLVSLGLGALPPEEKNKMLAHIYDTLEMRVGMKLAEQMSEQQLSDFEKFIDSNDESGALKWLETNFPNYKQVVADELEKLKSEISSVAPQILASSGVDPNSLLPTQSPAANSESPQPTTPTN
jgi:predicted RNA-binding Zn ribbon-like protein